MGGLGPAQKRKEEGLDGFVGMVTPKAGKTVDLSLDIKKLENSLSQNARGRYYVEFTGSRDTKVYKEHFSLSGRFHPIIGISPFRFDNDAGKGFAVYPKNIKKLQVVAGLSQEQCENIQGNFAHISYVENGMLVKAYGNVKQAGKDTGGDFIRLAQDTGTAAKIYLKSITGINAYGKQELALD